MNIWLIKIVIEGEGDTVTRLPLPHCGDALLSIYGIRLQDDGKIVLSSKGSSKQRKGKVMEIRFNELGSTY